MRNDYSKQVGFAAMLLICLFCTSLVDAQNLKPRQNSQENVQISQVDSPSNSSNQSPFDAVKGKREDLKKRDAFSKHYINEDGSFTALIGAGPIHYEKNGQFLDINHTIEPQMDVQFPYANTANLFSSYFGATSHTGIKNKTAEGEVKEFLNTSMYWEVNGQAVGKINSANVPVSVQGDKAYYHNIYGNIAAEFAVLTGKRKLNYIIPNPEALGSVPAGADYLVFTEDVILPFGWTSTITDSGVMIKDQLGQEIYLYENPHSTDAESHALREENTIFETSQIGNTLTIKTKVKTEWLLSNERVFPVMVDPTTNVYPNNATNWTRSTSGSGTNYTNLRFGVVGTNSAIWAVTSMKFNTATIPANATINNAIGYFYITEAYEAWGGTVRYAYSADPTTNSGVNLYNSVNGELSNKITMNTPNNSWKNITLNSTGVNHIQSNINSTVNLGLDPVDGYSYYGQYYAAVNHTDSNRPYLSITYTVPAGPPSCAVLIHPANNSIGSGNQNLSLSWNEVGGATSYDLYFGTTSNPPLLASNLTSTSTLISDCLDPNTKYYWKVIPKNAYGSPTTCSTWSFTTDGKLHIYQNDWETTSTGFFPTSGTSVDGWYTNNNSGSGGSWSSGYNNTWTVGNGPYAISGNSVGVSALQNGVLAGDFFQYWSDLGEIHRWIYRPFDMRGLRDIEVSFKWKAGGEANQDYGSVISSINGGANWLMEEQGGLNNDGKYWNSPNTIREQTVLFPETRNNQQNFQLGFKWDDWSGNGVSSDPSFVVDDIIVKACPFEGVIDSDKVGANVFEWIPEGSTQTTLTIEGSHSCAFYQWEQSTDDGNTWVNVIGGSGGDSVSYTTPDNLTVTTLYRAKVYFGTSCTGVYQEESFKILIENCATETTWNGTAWSNGIPVELTKRIIFDGNYVSSADPDYPTTTGLIGCSVEVRNNAQVVISADHSVTIDNEIVVAGTASFTLENNANLVQIASDAENEGIITAKRYSAPVIRQDATGWSSPVSGQNVRSFSTGTLKKRYYIYNGYGEAGTGGSSFKALFEYDALYPMPNPIPTGWIGDRITVGANQLFDETTYTFQKGFGYSIRVPNNWSSTTSSPFLGEFTGEPHNGNVEVPAYGKYTMVGNPYPSPIRITGTNGFFAKNPNVETLHFWTHHFPVGHPDYNNNYVTYTRTGGAGNHPGGGIQPNEIIPVAQGFVVENGAAIPEESNTPWSVYFNNGMRVTSTNGIFFKNDNEIERHRFWLSLRNNSEEKTAQILIGYMTGATYEFDHQIDGKRMGGAPLFSLIEDEKYTVQGRALPFEDSDVIPIGFIAIAAGNYTIGIDELDGFFTEGLVQIYIRDKAKGKEHNLSESDYLFETEEGEFLSRFEIIYKTEEVLGIGDLDKNLVEIFRSGQNIVIRSEKENILSVESYDMSGKNIHRNDKVNSKTYLIRRTNLATQILIIKVLTESGEIVTKKVIN